MKIALVALGLLAFAGTTRAACPNACSGHGTCGTDDQCICHSNFEGGDCSQRVCPYGNAWVTTANGDLNFDGDRFDGTQYNKDYTFDKNLASAQLATQRSPGGDWESWPYYAKSGEGHFLMECSNRGLCSRDTGECQCFEGYTGSACQRSSCPSGCSGHGSCESITEMKVVQGTGKAYDLWDKDMQRTCLCDSGYTGIACNQRTCPLGDDPLTTHDYFQDRAVQYISVSADTPFHGQLALVYTAPDGEKYTTDRFDTAGTLGTGAEAALALAAETALRSLPNNVLSAVEVKAGACEKLVGGFFKLSFTDLGTKDEAVSFEAASNPYGNMHEPTGLSAPTAPTSGLIRHGNQVYDMDDGGKLVFGYASKLSGASTPMDDTSITEVQKRHCVRYEVTFTGRSGNVALLGIDTTAVTVPAPGASIKGKDGSTIKILSSGQIEATVDQTGITGNHHNGLPNTFKTYLATHATCDGVSYGIGTVTAVGSNAVTYAERSGLGVYDNAAADTCTSTQGVEIFEMIRHASYPRSNVMSSAVATRSLTKEAAFAVMVKDGNDVTPCDPLVDAYQTAGCASWIIRCDFVGVTKGTDDEDSGGAIRLDSGQSKLTCKDDDSHIRGPTGAVTDMNTHIHYNSRVNVYCNGVLHGTFTVLSSTEKELIFQEIVHDCNGDYVSNAAGDTTNRNTDVLITLADQEIKSAINLYDYRSFIQDATIKINVKGVDEHCKVQSILTNSASTTVSNRIICSNTFGKAAEAHGVTDTAQSISLVGTSGSEASTCSDRGLCNFETGMCDCFSGYTGIACESQNALHI